MNLLPIGLLGAAALFLIRPKQETRQLVQGQSYIAVLQLPAAISEDQLGTVLPGGASVQLDGLRAVVTFTAPRSAIMQDIPTPVGVIKVLSVKRVSDAVGALEFAKPSAYTFGSWVPRADRMGLRFAGWTVPKTMSFEQALGVMANLPGDFRRAYRWTGSSWEKV